MTLSEMSRVCDELAEITVWDALERTARRLPEKVAVVDGERRLTYGELVQEADRLARGLAGLGLGKGSVVAVYMPNGIELYTLFYALQSLGVVVAWLNPNYRDKEARFIIENSGARAVFLFDEWQGHRYLPSVLGLEDLPELRHVVAVRRGSGAWPADPRVKDFETLAADAAPPAPRAPVGPDDIAMLIYTSGTTGRPKGATISQSQVVRAGWAYSLGVNATEDDVFIGFLPMSHSYGCGALLMQPLLLGASVAVLDVFSPERAFQVIQRERVTLQLGAPAHYIMELNHPSRRQYDLSSLRAGLIAGQIAPAGLITRVQQEMGIHIASFLGSSEVGPGLSIILPYPSPLEVREKYIGYPLVGTQARVVDPVTGIDKAPGEPGELLLAGWHVTRGYWNNREETEKQIRDGWLHTGDLAARDDQGCFRILGRIKEWINRGGLKIIPSEIEALIVQHPAVVEVCVVGTANPILGESSCACVRVDEAAPPLTLEELRGLLRGKVADYKLPDELLVLREFPRLSGGIKVNRFGAGGVVELANSATDKQVLRR
ncbi:MAG: class I adenylate-forming enzyme family protein [Deferrisomatales bacterium]